MRATIVETAIRFTLLTSLLNLLGCPPGISVSVFVCVIMLHMYTGGKL